MRFGPGGGRGGEVRGWDMVVRWGLRCLVHRGAVGDAGVGVSGRRWTT